MVMTTDELYELQQRAEAGRKLTEKIAWWKRLAKSAGDKSSNSIASNFGKLMNDAGAHSGDDSYCVCEVAEAAFTAQAEKLQKQFYELD